MTIPDQIATALTLPNFDPDVHRRKMSVGNRIWSRPSSRPGQPRIGAVVCLLYPAHDDLRVVLTKRPQTLKNHSGQVSFPGGRVDAGETHQQAAVRELWEEVGVTADHITVLGKLTPLYIYPSDFEVYPFVAWSPARPTYTPNPAEVEQIIEPTLTQLSDLANWQTHQREINDHTFDVPQIDVDGTIVWGATAMMLAEWLGRWQHVN